MVAGHGRVVPAAAAQTPRRRLPSGWPHGRAPHQDLHPDRRRRHHRARRLQPGRARPTVRLAAYADTDEANAALGVAVTVGGLAERRGRALRQVQNDLFDVGADLCTPIVAEPEVPAAAGHRGLRRRAWRAGATSSTPSLPKLDSFILPGGTPGAAYLHVARTVARRAERSLGAAARPTPSAPTRSPRSTSTGSPTCCSSSAGWPTRDGDVLWQPGGAPAPG